MATRSSRPRKNLSRISARRSGVPWVPFVAGAGPAGSAVGSRGDLRIRASEAIIGYRVGTGDSQTAGRWALPAVRTSRLGVLPLGRLLPLRRVFDDSGLQPVQQPPPEQVIPPAPLGDLQPSL